MTTIQMIKRILISSKFEKLPQKKEGDFLSQNKTYSEFILISSSHVSQT